MKIWGVRVYIISGRVTIKNIDDGSHLGYLIGYVATIRVIIYWNPVQTFLSTGIILFGLINIFIVSP